MRVRRVNLTACACDRWADRFSGEGNPARVGKTEGVQEGSQSSCQGHVLVRIELHTGGVELVALLGVAGYGYSHSPPRYQRILRRMSSFVSPVLCSLPSCHVVFWRKSFRRKSKAQYAIHRTSKP
jgi:hypothetical protein